MMGGWCSAVGRPYVVVTGADDKTTHKPATLSGDGTLTFDGAKFVFFVLFSNTTFEISLKGRSGPANYLVGKASDGSAALVCLGIHDGGPAACPGSNKCWALEYMLPANWP